MTKREGLPPSLSCVGLQCVSSLGQWSVCVLGIFYIKMERTPSVFQQAIHRNFARNEAKKLAIQRAEWFAKWTERARQLQSVETECKQSLPSHVRKRIEAQAPVIVERDFGRHRI